MSKDQLKKLHIQTSLLLYVNELSDISNNLYDELLREKEKIKYLSKEIKTYQAKLTKLKEKI